MRSRLPKFYAYYSLWHSDHRATAVSALFAVGVVAQPLVARIGSGGNRTTYASLDAAGVTLDAAPSFDPDQEDDSNSSAAFAYAWTCTRLVSGASCATAAMGVASGTYQHEPISAP